MSEKIVVLYLRQSTGSGGGADTIILNSATHIDSSQFLLIVVYLRKFSEDLSIISNSLKERRVSYFEFPGTSIFNVKQFINIIKLIRQYKVRIIHSHDPKTDFYGYLLKIFFPKLKIISTIHGWTRKRYRSILYTKLDKFLLKKFDAVIAVSENIEQIAKKHGIYRTHLIQNGIDINKWQPEKRDIFPEDLTRHFTVGFVGRISKEKGPIDFVRVAQKILNQEANCEFWVAGGGPGRKSMRLMIKQLGVENKFQFLGQLDDNKLHTLYQKLDLFLLTSYTEGLPMTILEACAMSVPVVATNVGGVSEIITHDYNGFLADAGDIDTLASLVLKIKHNKELANSFKKNGRITVEEKFSFSARIKKIEEVYLQTI